MKQIKKVLGIFLVPYIYVYLYALSYKNYLISLFKPDVISVFNSHQKYQSILLIALFEKTYLRKDIIRLLEISKRAGLYVVAVNTRKLSTVFLEEHQHLFDVYISQYNYGRDFASYQKGFKYIFKNKLQQNAERIVMLNDSLYYDADRTPQFLDDMINTPVEVLGATENYEINYHLGSFAISFAKKITNNAKFIKYWKNYKRSDIRPLVIKRGEMGLSKILAKIVSNEFEMKALYNAQRVRSYLNHSLVNLLEYSKYYRNSDLCDWRRVSNVGLLEEFLLITRLSPNREEISGIKSEKQQNSTLVKIQRNNTNIQISDIHVTNIDDVGIYLDRVSGKSTEIVQEFYEHVISQSVTYSRFGSQIHQNNACYLLMGLPIIKLDGMYRGMFSEKDISNFKELLNLEFFEELIEILYKKPYGEDFLHGWKRVAFKRGLI
jgi:hypothetical protein